MSSAAVALIATEPATVDPDTGAVMVTVGAVVSVAAAVSVEPATLLAEMLPTAS